MARFYGAVGYALTEEVAPGVYEDRLVEHNYYGDVTRNTRSLSGSNVVLDNISTGNSISIVADAYAYEHFFQIRYVVWMGVPWEVQTIEVERPRLILRLGEVYNGPTPS